MEFADAVEELDARIPFKMQSRCDLMTRGTVDALRRAGCAEVWMGAESGSQKVLDAMDKGLRVEQVDAACANLRAHGIRAGCFLQFGYPGESWEDIQRTIAMVRGRRPDDIGVRCPIRCRARSSTSWWKRSSAQKQNWDDSDDLSMMFKGAYAASSTVRCAMRCIVKSRGADGAEPGSLAARRIARTNLRTARSHPAMDLLLTHGYFLHEDPKELQIMKPYAPLGILYLSSHLRARASTSRFTIRRSDRSEELFRHLRAGPPSVLGIGANLMTRAQCDRDRRGRAARRVGR